MMATTYELVPVNWALLVREATTDPSLCIPPEAVAALRLFCKMHFPIRFQLRTEGSTEEDSVMLAGQMTLFFVPALCGKSGCWSLQRGRVRVHVHMGSVYAVQHVDADRPGFYKLFELSERYALRLRGTSEAEWMLRFIREHMLILERKKARTRHQDEIVCISS